jgi:hypothetical protein
MFRARALFALACVAGLGCKRAAPPAPVPVTSEAKPLPPAALATSLVVIARSSAYFGLFELGDAVFAMSSPILARVDGGRFEPTPELKDLWVTELFGQWPDRTFAISSMPGCRGPGVFKVARLTEGKWQANESLRVGDQAWGDGRIVRRTSGKLAWVTDTGVDESNTPTADASSLGSSCTAGEIYVSGVKGRWTFGDATVHCYSTDTGFVFAWRPGELVGKPLPPSKSPAFHAKFVDAKGTFWGEGWVEGTAHYDPYYLEGTEWKRLESPVPNARIGVVQPSSTGLVATIEDGAHNQLWRRDIAGQWTKVAIEDDEPANPLILDMLLVHGEEIWMRAHRETGKKNIALLHNGKTKSFE